MNTRQYAVTRAMSMPLFVQLRSWWLDGVLESDPLHGPIPRLPGGPLLIPLASCYDKGEVATGGAAGATVQESVVVCTCSFSSVRFCRGSSRSVIAAPAAQKIPATMNAQLNPCVSARGCSASARSALVVPLVETVERIASPPAS